MRASLLYVTAGTREEAEKISHYVVSEKLAACANIIGETSSIYYWNGCLNKDKEIAFFLKTSRQKVKLLIERIVELHSYDCPCIITTDIVDGNHNFLDWIIAQTSTQNIETI